MRATVLEIRTTLEPAKTTSTHRIVIGPNAARSTADGERWSLFDFRGNRVVTVDQLEQSVRSEPLPALIARRRAAFEADAPEDLPQAEYARTNESQVLLGVPARQSVVKMGQYARQIWVAEHPGIPAQLFSMMHAAESPSALAPLAREPEEALLAIRGFPLLDRAELPYGDKKMTVERVVTAIRQEDVPASMFELPAGFRQVAPPAVPPARPRKEVKREATMVETPPPTTTTVTTASTSTTATTDTTATTGTTATTDTTGTTEKPKVVEKPKPKPKPATTKKAPAKKPVPKKAPPKKKTTAPATKKKT